MHSSTGNRRKVNGNRLKPHTGGPTMWLNGSSIVLVLQAVERRHETINYTAQVGELHNWKMVWSEDVSLGLRQCGGSCATQGEITQISWKVTIKVTVHEKTVEVRPNGVGDQHLRWNLWVRSFKICRQSEINEPISGGMVGFELKFPYKLQVVVQQETLGILSIQLLSS